MRAKSFAILMLLALLVAVTPIEQSISTYARTLSGSFSPAPQTRAVTSNRRVNTASSLSRVVADAAALATPTAVLPLLPIPSVATAVTSTIRRCTADPGMADTVPNLPFCLTVQQRGGLVTLTLTSPLAAYCAVGAAYEPSGRSVQLTPGGWTRQMGPHGKRTYTFAIDPAGRYGSQLYTKAACGYPGTAAANNRTVAFQLDERVYGDWNCASTPAPTAGNLCLTVTRQGSTFSLLVSSPAQAECILSATYFPPIQQIQLNPPGATLRRTDSQGMALYTFSGVRYPRAGDHVLTSAECAPRGDTGYVDVTVDFQTGTILYVPLAQNVQASTPPATATAAQATTTIPTSTPVLSLPTSTPTH